MGASQTASKYGDRGYLCDVFEVFSKKGANASKLQGVLKNVLRFHCYFEGAVDSIILVFTQLHRVCSIKKKALSTV